TLGGPGGCVESSRGGPPPARGPRVNPSLRHVSSLQLFQVCLVFGVLRCRSFLCGSLSSEDSPPTSPGSVPSLADRWVAHSREDAMARPRIPNPPGPSVS